jgi:hypothetical protein
MGDTFLFAGEHYGKFFCGFSLFLQWAVFLTAAKNVEIVYFGIKKIR